MKHYPYNLLFVFLLSNVITAQSLQIGSKPVVNVTLDLIQLSEDRVRVTLVPENLKVGDQRFLIPKTVPGTYSEDNYGTYVEDLKALGRDGEPLSVRRENENSWWITAPEGIQKITYFVNDSYDMEGGTASAPFSPAGTNILEGQNFMLNLHGFIGYFQNLNEIPYEIQILAPEQLFPATSLPGQKEGTNSYLFHAERYFEVIDNPIQFTDEPAVSFQVDDITINLSVYSPSKVYDAARLSPAMERMMRAQRSFLGAISGTKTYTILLYLSQMNQDALGFGALEHHTSTVVVLPEQMPAPELEEAMIDVVSHEFFHTLTPLNVHSEEIQYFDFNEPVMSQHLWMYEGTTEYFANLFQIREGLIDEGEFYRRMYTKIMNAQGYNDSLSFTEMSRNVLKEPYDTQYANVYEKGALINMSLDILLRSLSSGTYGLIDLMRELSQTYDVNHPFKDEALFSEIEAKTYPEVRAFFEKYVIGSTPIDYSLFLEKVGLNLGEVEVQSGHFLTDMESAIPFVDISPSNPDEIFVRSGITLNTFLKDLGVQAGDVITEVNGVSIDLNGIRDIIVQSLNWAPDTAVTMQVKRGAELLTLKGNAGNPTYNEMRIAPMENATENQKTLRLTWLKG